MENVYQIHFRLIDYIVDNIINIVLEKYIRTNDRSALVVYYDLDNKNILEKNFRFKLVPKSHLNQYISQELLNMQNYLDAFHNDLLYCTIVIIFILNGKNELIYIHHERYKEDKKLTKNVFFDELEDTHV